MRKGRLIVRWQTPLTVWCSKRNARQQAPELHVYLEGPRGAHGEVVLDVVVRVPPSHGAASLTLDPRLRTTTLQDLNPGLAYAERSGILHFKGLALTVTEPSRSTRF